MCMQEALPIAADAAALASGNPLLIAAAAATTAGNYIQARNNRDSQQAQYDAKTNQLAVGQEQQSKFADQNTQNLAPAIKASAPNSTDLGALITARQNTINSAATPSTGSVAGTESNAPKLVQSNLADTLANSAAFAKQQGDALGYLGGINDASVGGNLAAQESARKIGATNTIAQTDAVANLAQANSAYNNARKSPSIWGEGLSTAGTIAGLAAPINGLSSINAARNAANAPAVLNPNSINSFFAPPSG